ncbi:MAG TPA: histidinol dehydrogenase [Steroidobacteraceae bacterium]|nr:histidinol dehydrogenase [Steroidobacteraceae bacterium]
MMPILEWRTLTSAQRTQALRRPTQETRAEIVTATRDIIAEVRAGGDTALLELTHHFDGADLDGLAVSDQEFEAARAKLASEARRALERAIDNVRRFHEAQVPAPLSVETTPGVRCEQRVVPIRAVGLYVPAGSAPLPSTAVMLAVPAEIARCPERVLCTPPQADGTANAAVLYVAQRCGIERVFKIGGAQAVAAMAYGTQSVPKVDKIFGPGNAWVTTAKQLIAQDADGAACDLPAGPSEVLVIADESARADFVAADLLAQAEHSPDAQVMLVTPSRRLAREVCQQIEQQLVRLGRHQIVRQSLGGSRIVLVDDLAAALEVSNAYGPEHLILEVEQPRRWLERVANAGSVFLGAWSPEPMGDYCTGTNHVLPTEGYARVLSGLSLVDFTKRISVQELSADGLRDLGPVARTLAQLEGLDAHANAVSIRLEALGRADR